MNSVGFWGATFKKDPDGESAVSNVAGMMFPAGVMIWTLVWQIFFFETVCCAMASVVFVNNPRLLSNEGENRWQEWKAWRKFMTLGSTQDPVKPYCEIYEQRAYCAASTRPNPSKVKPWFSLAKDSNYHLEILTYRNDALEDVSTIKYVSARGTWLLNWGVHRQIASRSSRRKPNQSLSRGLVVEGQGPRTGESIRVAFAVLVGNDSYDILWLWVMGYIACALTDWLTDPRHGSCPMYHHSYSFIYLSFLHPTSVFHVL